MLTNIQPISQLFIHLKSRIQIATHFVTSIHIFLLGRKENFSLLYGCFSKNIKCNDENMSWSHQNVEMIKNALAK